MVRDRLRACSSESRPDEQSTPSGWGADVLDADAVSVFGGVEIKHQK